MRLHCAALIFSLSVMACQAEKQPPKNSFSSNGHKIHELQDLHYNIIIVFTDDQGYADLGVQGLRDDILTPNIDALAKSGVRFTNGYVTAPQCVPSRIGLLTGRNQAKLGITTNLDLRKGAIAKRFDEAETLAETLGKAGYRTGMSGKWHIELTPQPENHGFEEVFIVKSKHGRSWTMDFEDNNLGKRVKQTGGYHIDVGADFSTSFIQKYSDEPFFFYWAPRAPHIPLDAPTQYTDRFPGHMPAERRQALGMISAVDDGVGRIVAALEAEGIRDNTLIFVLSDNGAPLSNSRTGAVRWNGSINGGLTGEKGMLTEGGIRIPFVASLPSRIEPGQVEDRPVTSLDIAATIADLAKLQPKLPYDGKSLLSSSAKVNENRLDEALYWDFGTHAAMREGDWKIILFHEKSYIYNLLADPSEKVDLSTSEPERVKKMEAKFEAWRQTLPVKGAINEKKKRESAKHIRLYESYVTPVH